MMHVSGDVAIVGANVHSSADEFDELVVSRSDQERMLAGCGELDQALRSTKNEALSNEIHGRVCEDGDIVVWSITALTKKRTIPCYVIQ